MSDIKAERIFLHDLSTPLAVALFSMDLSLEGLGESIAAEEIANLKRIQTSLEKIRRLVEERRAVLMKEMLETAPAEPEGKKE